MRREEWREVRRGEKWGEERDEERRGVMVMIEASSGELPAFSSAPAPAPTPAPAGWTGCWSPTCRCCPSASGLLSSAIQHTEGTKDNVPSGKGG